jgi:hypothetical protein
MLLSRLPALAGRDPTAVSGGQSGANSVPIAHPTLLHLRAPGAKPWLARGCVADRLSFAIGLRWGVRPNNSFKPKPLRGSA